MTSKNPEPFISIGAQALVQDSCKVHCGMVRKENRVKKWQDRYLVLHKGCLYYFKDSNDKTAQGQFSLSGYRLSKAPEKNKYEWTFKLTHFQPEKRAYYFAAHSEKELDEWIEKIQEDILEFCEIRRPGNHTEDSSGEETEDQHPLAYDYPLVEPVDFNALKRKILNESVTSSKMTSSSSEEWYCPPTDIFASSPKPLPPRPTQAKPCSLTANQPFHIPQKTGDISKVIGKKTVFGCNNQAAVDIAKVLTSQHPKPDLRKRLSDTTAASPLTSHKPPLLPKPHKIGHSTGFKSDSKEDMYLELNNDELEEPAPRLSTLQRNRPDGKSFKAKDSEALNVLPPSAHRLDFNKTQAIPLLSGYDGAYMIHSSRKGSINQALSVCIRDKVKHFLIFCNEECTEYGLDPKGPFFKSIESMLKNYYEKPLPNQDCYAVLQIPYK